MTPPRLTELRDDLREQCQFLVEDTSDASREEFENDRVLKRAAERYLTIIGEIGTNIRYEFPDVYESLPDLRYAVGLRNRLAHGYGEAIKEDIIWETIKVSIPNLIEAIDSSSHRSDD